MREVNQRLKFKYELIRQLGEGSSSTVYLVRHRKLSKLLVLKEVSLSSNTGFQHQNEVLVLKNLSFPGIPELYEYEEDDEYTYIVEEYISGESLHTVLMQSISQEHFISYSCQMANLIFSLHNYGLNPILYVDMKEEHFIINDNVVHLVDFGLAVEAEGGIATGIYHGTEEYSAPEVINKHVATVQSDIYSLGKLFYNMFLNTTFLDREVEKEIERLIEQMVQEDPKKRPLTMRDVLEKINQLENFSKDSDTENLKKQIAVIGSQHRVGTTFVATLLTSCLNRRNLSACYFENPQDRWILSSTLNKKPGGEIIWRGKSCFYPDYGPFVKKEKKNHQENNHSEIKICDCGVFSKDEQYEKYDLVILVLGARPWEQLISYEVAQEVKGVPNHICFCSLQTRKEVKELARIIQKELIHVPTVSDVYRPGKRLSKKVAAVIKSNISNSKY